MARKSNNINCGDLIYYCPPDLEKKYYEFGLVLYTEQDEYTIAWQSSAKIETYSFSHIKRGLLKKTFLLIKV